MNHPSLSDYPKRTTDKLRYADTDRQGHVNNAVFATFLETGRVEILHDEETPLAATGCAFVIARLELDFINEITWPGEVEIGTAVAKVGTSSFTLDQGVFQADKLVARAKTVIVQMDETSRKSSPLTDDAVKRLNDLLSSA
ncbi:thioesterase superfamily protein [Roseibium sp. TrichSKD4]|uniref:acyl-CoA thioesterase n=1 Tax=Roseibium sp. TrichSKD4 TaxID=744980 RepID=UPI0001E561AA|nr:thioesterase family protein [Roseibium sp. TrichSKD4]EFO33733.1 thioesterase superfamily protein [Roseibium sp. TrichSKD4]